MRMYPERKIIFPLCLLATMAIPLHADEETRLPAWEEESIADVRTRLEQRAERGDAKTQNRLGNIYYHGDGVPKDLEQARYWFRKAAEQGYAPGQFNLARLYREGKGVEQDYSRAVRWYEKAAKQGLAMAQFFLGKSYAEGQGVPKDPVLAYYWLDRAAIQGDADAEWVRDRLTKTMSPRQLAEVGKGVVTKAGKETPPGKASLDGPSSPATQATARDSTPKPSRKPDSKSDPQAKRKTSLSRAETRTLQRRLHALGFDPGPADGVFGQKTRIALEEFQKSIGLEPDGRISQQLLEALYAAPQLTRALSDENGGAAQPPKRAATKAGETPSLSRAETRTLQRRLHTLGFDPGPADGVSGQKTRIALEEFQKSIGLEPDGRISQQLLEALYAAPQLTRALSDENGGAAQPPKRAATKAGETPSLSRAETRTLQRRLHTLGFDPGPADGVSGQKTRIALEEFQKSIGLEPDGRISQQLLEALYAAPPLSDENGGTAQPPKRTATKAGQETPSRNSPPPATQATARDSTPKPDPKLDPNIGPRTQTKISLSRAETRILQRRLHALGFDPGPIDGIPGQKTRIALEEFQKSIGLQPDGRISQELLETLYGASQNKTN
uniref:Sel1 repeat-containing protein n=1 Tax=Candidatus Kentrum sp. FM TaxID=2126340 RepID=A0A450T3K3_9GAMM|nr:MAG: Sel1 repeat-containing protein [Candidatus Kentron sp. FM]